MTGLERCGRCNQWRNPSDLKRGWCLLCQRHLPQTRPERRLAELVEDVEWLAGTDRPDLIAARVGVPSLGALEARLRRAGRADLWRKLAREVA